MDGDKVRLTIRFRGRQIIFKEEGKKILQNFIHDLEDISFTDKNIMSEGKKIFVLLQNKKAKK